MEKFKRKYRRTGKVVDPGRGTVFARKWDGKNDPKPEGFEYSSSLDYCYIGKNEMKCRAGDWIIIEHDGYQYPCVDEMFLKTFEPISNPDDPNETKIINFG